MTKTYLLGLVILLFASCDKEYYFNGKLPDPKLVLYSFIEPDSVILVQVTRTRGIGQSDDTYVAKGVEGEIYIDGILKGHLRHLEHHQYTTDIKATEGQKVRLIVRSADTPEVSAETTVPRTLPTVTIDTSVTSKTNVFDRISRTLNLRINIQEPDNAYRYYRLLVCNENTYKMLNPDSNESFIHSINNSYDFNKNNEPLLIDKVQDLPWDDEEDKNEYNIFSNEIFRGKSYSMNVNTPYIYSQIHKANYVGYEDWLEEIIVRYTIKVLLLDEPTYLYLKSDADAYQELGLLNDPDKIYSNVKNGLGVVGAYATYQKIIIPPHERNGIN